MTMFRQPCWHYRIQYQSLIMPHGSRNIVMLLIKLFLVQFIGVFKLVLFIHLLMCYYMMVGLYDSGHAHQFVPTRHLFLCFHIMQSVFLSSRHIFYTKKSCVYHLVWERTHAAVCAASAHHLYKKKLFKSFRRAADE